jgi:uncharacterized protein (DUF302 family)
MPYEEALQVVTAALKSQGFGIITTINVQATLKEKLNVNFRPYTILGACNPPIAHRALEHDARIGLMLPCNVSVEAAENGKILVRIADPDQMLAISGGEPDPVMAEIAALAREKLVAVAAALRAQP